jgi:methyl-accepting chemotaxis protein
MNGTSLLEPVLSTAEVRSRIETVVEAGDSLPYTRRNLVETALVHAAVALLAGLVLVAYATTGRMDGRVAPYIALGGIVLTAVAAIGLATRAVMKGQTFATTDTWDGGTAAVQLTLLVIGTYVTGGAASPLWFVAVIVTAYLAHAWDNRTGEIIAGMLALAAAGSAFVAGQWSGDDLPLAVTVTIGMPALFVLVMLNARGLYGDAEQRRFEQDILRARVNDLSLLLERAAAGDLKVAGHLVETLEGDVVDEDDNLVVLTRAFDQTLTALRSLVEQIRGSSAQLAVGTSQVLSAVQEHASIGEQQAAAAVETTGAMEELSATAAQIAMTSDSVARCAADALELAEQGRTAVAESLHAMTSLSTRAEQIQHRATGLGEMGEQIGQIVAAMDGLAEQTNMLALNAAIEAARAGDQGDGFAVVAGEVRRLAERSKHAAAQITAIVGQIQSETAAAVQESAAGCQEAAAGGELVQGVAAVLDRISERVDETTIAANEISTATEQQRVASTQVASAMTEVAESVRTSAAESAQAAAAVAQLDELSAALQGTIVRFHHEPV